MKHVFHVHSFLAASLLVAFCFAHSTATAQLTEEQKNDGWRQIFDGQTLEGWKSNAKAEGFKVEKDAIVGFGDRNHLYFMEELGNFELKIDVKINQGGNAGVYVKSQWQEEAWPTTGFELQVNSSQRDPAKTGSIYGIVSWPKAPHGDDEWFTYHIICNRNRIEVRVNDELLYTYTDPMQNTERPEEITERTKRISQRGYIALQQHDPNSSGQFKNIYIKKLPENRGPRR